MSGTAAVIDDGSIAANAMMSVDETPELTHEVFLQHMNAMKAHYKAANGPNAVGPSHAYALPVHLMFAPVSAFSGHGQGMAAAASPGKTQVDAIITGAKNNTVAFTQNQTNAVNAATRQLQSDKNTSDFAAKMRAQGQKSKDDYNKLVDKYTDDLIEQGTKNPDQQQRILDLTTKLGAFVTDLLAKVANFLQDILHKVIAWVGKAVDFVKSAAATVGDWAGKAGRAIEHFFGSLF